MKAFYYLNGSWVPYSTASEFIVSPDKNNVAFKFIANSTNKLTTANGTRVQFSHLGISKPLNNSVTYYKRIGSTGPSLFAIDFSDLSNAIVTDLPKVADTKKSSLWLLLLAGLGYLTLG